MRNDTTYSLKIPIMANDTILIPGCEFATSVTSTTYDADDMQGCTVPTLSVKKVLAAIPGSKVVKLSNGTGIPANKFLQLPSSNASLCCLNPTDWYKILRDLAAIPDDLPLDYEDCRVSNYNPAYDNYCATGAKQPKDPYVTDPHSIFSVN